MLSFSTLPPYTDFYLGKEKRHRATQGEGGTSLNCGTYASLPVLRYFQAFETHPPLVCILVNTVLKYCPQFYTHPPLVCILVYTVLKYFPQFYTHPSLVSPGMYFSLHGTNIFFGCPFLRYWLRLCYFKNQVKGCVSVKLWKILVPCRLKYIQRGGWV